MLQQDDTKLEIFGFGDENDEEDTFYCLVNTKKSPDGIDLEKLSNADPRKFDEALNEMGCILLLRGDEIEELINRDAITDADLQKSLYELAVDEGIIK
ncbi:hypothetical protein LQ318_13060 [Aliifodinibius salicampi]|uniref:Immunity protein 51 n=1 Tax=Fodinibius salicampi TaxID=1920655 RepID=A0ABT3Q157_9BACT|nr:hypothetical protein [Fodinibius salicampi]MCW9713835.1 hypothetical protein [Fodinibius salicampi]